MPDQSKQLGERVNSLRLKRELSIEQLAERCGLATGHIGAIESCELSPPLGEIVALAGALQVSLGELFGDEADSPFCIVRGDSRKSVARFGATGGGYTYESLGHQKQNRHMEPFLVTLEPHSAPDKPNQHPGEEILFVIDGQVRVNLAAHTDILNPGDSIYYDSNLPHIVACHGDRPATLMAVIYTEPKIHIF